MNNPKPINDIPATGHFNFVYGSFKLSKWSVPFMTTTMSLTEVSKSLRLASELPSSETIEWKIEELFQRSIDWKRVSDQIVPYLENEEVPQFFNSLTIALVPFKSGEDGVSFSLGTDTWNPPQLDNKEAFSAGAGSVQTIGPMTIGWWDAKEGEIGTIGVLRWNPDEVFSVAIDGQHRLASIKEAIKHAAQGGDKKWNETRVSVVLLVFDESLGYSAPENQTPVQVMRRLFIDMNKNAQKVSRARQILLDDYEPHAACVRQMIGEGLTSDLRELSPGTGQPQRMPLALVDWASEQAKFDTGPYLTTVLLVDWIVNKVLATKPIVDLMDYSLLQKQIKTFEDRLYLNLSNALGRLDKDKTFERSFNYSAEDLTLIGKSFGEVWAEPVIYLLTAFFPYAQIIETRLAGDSLSLDFQTWHELYKKTDNNKTVGNSGLDNNYEIEYKTFLNTVKNRVHNPIALSMFEEKLSAIEVLKEDNVAFKVVFQHALVEAFIEFARITRDDLAEFHEFHGVELPASTYFGELDEDDDEDSKQDDEDDYFIEAGAIGADGPTEFQRESAKLVLELAILFIAALNRVWENSDCFYDQDGQLPSEGTKSLSKGYSQRFWQGTFRKPEGDTDHTQGASTRAKDLIFIAAVMIVADDIFEPDVPSDFDRFWNLIRPSSQEPIPKILGRARAAAKRYCRDNDKSAAARIFEAADKGFDDGIAEDMLRSRIKEMWDSAGL